jgi:hypothetical protein
MCDKCPDLRADAQRLTQADTYKSLTQLIVDLNALGHLNGAGFPYSGERGVARLLSCCYDHHIAMGDPVGADMIATAFVDRKDEWPWDK